MSPNSASGRPPVIVTDAACDVPVDLVAQYGIHVAPLRLMFGAESYLSGVDITPEQFYARLARRDVHPTTSQPTVPEFVELYRRLGRDGQPILSIHLSEGLSGTINSARQAARELPDQDITVYDSRTLTSAMGLQVTTAARAAAAGMSAAQIVPLLVQEQAVGGMFFSVDDLSYLHRGGRIGAVQYQVGQLLHIKPIVTVAKHGDTAGTYISAGRARSLIKAGEVFIKNIVEHLGAGAKLRAIALYGDDPALAEDLLRRVRATFDCVFLAMVPTAPVLGVHVGPKALGIGYAGGDWPIP